MCRRLAAPWCAAGLLAIAVVLGLPGPAAAQQSGQASLAPPRPDEAIAAFNRLEPWVRAGAVSVGPSPAPGGAVSIILRLDGAVVGRGTSSEPDALAAAAGRAIEEAASRLPGQHDALQAEQAAATWARVTISLELAGPLVPFSPGTFDDVDAEISPGIEGVGARVGSRVELVFPGSMLTWNTGPGESLASAISKSLDDATVAIRNTPKGEPGAIGRERGVTFYRFHVTHLAQSDPKKTPVFLERGGRAFDQSALDTGALRAWADGLASNLLAQCTADTPSSKVITSVRGTYWPATGRYDPPVADTLDQVLVARALDRYARVVGKDSAQGRRARVVSGEILDALGQRPLGKDGPDSSPATGALWSVALAQSDFGAITDWLVPRGQMYRACLYGLEAAERDIAGVPEAQRAAVAFALARRAGETWPGIPDDPAAQTARRASARKALDGVYAATPPGNLVTQMPWLGWGDMYLSAESIAAAPALREMREQVYAHALTRETAGRGNSDLIGGVVFTASRSAMPTWQTVRPAAFLASALGDARLTGSDEALKEISRLLGVLRFLRQLTADESIAWMCQEPDKARWGVRAAAWDQRQAPEATAMTLITVCETLRSLDEIAKRGAAR